MSLIEVISKYNFNHIEAKKSVQSIITRYPDLTQIGLTHSNNDLNDFEKVIESTGTLYDYDNKVYRHKETDFVEFNNTFKDTYIYEMYRSLPNIGRTRIMIMDGPRCYTIHRDLSKRYHYVIQTNHDCFFIFPELGKYEHIPCDNNLYLVDTRYRHTFINGSRQRRIHIVFDDLSTL